MAKNNFQEYICRPYCSFFKTGEKEDMACRGAEIVDLLVHKGLINAIELPSLKKDSSLWERYRTDFGDRICSPCPFRPADCDFQAADPPLDNEPCGGFILLALLYNNRLIRIGDLEN